MAPRSLGAQPQRSVAHGNGLEFRFDAQRIVDVFRTDPNTGVREEAVVCATGVRVA
jgi:hypothetical protein